MESFYVEIINPKAKHILKSLVNLKLIRVQKTEPRSNFSRLLKKFRKNTDLLLLHDEITNEAKTAMNKNPEILNA